MLRMVPLPRRGRGGWGSHVPSPCGDVVLKYMQKLRCIKERRSMVSVPLRGCGFEIEGRPSSNIYYLSEFPSPCGDMLYSPPLSDGGGGERCEPVGALTADVPFSRWRCADRSRRPFHHASHGPPPPPRQGRLGFARSVPLRGYALFASPVGRGRWRAVRAGRGACSGCTFLTMEMRRSFKAPLPPCFAWSPSPAAAGEAGVRTFRPLAGMWF